MIAAPQEENWDTVAAAAIAAMGFANLDIIRIPKDEAARKVAAAAIAVLVAGIIAFRESGRGPVLCHSHSGLVRINFFVFVRHTVHAGDLVPLKEMASYKLNHAVPYSRHVHCQPCQIAQRAAESGEDHGLRPADQHRPPGPQPALCDWRQGSRLLVGEGESRPAHHPAPRWRETSFSAMLTATMTPTGGPGAVDWRRTPLRGRPS